MDKALNEKYTAVIGLEVHAQLATASKIYNADANSFGNEPNENISTITLGHPGTLPFLNKKVIEFAIKMGLACQCEISREMIIDRKNYFYPDLPKGYQLTQDRTPICLNGIVKVTPNEGKERDIKLNRIHFEEDAGKSIHLEGEEDTYIDFNRSGVPLIEIVTEPDIHTSSEAAAFLAEVRRMVRYLEICDGNMEEGSLRCDANISVMLKGAQELGKKVEVKNMNSIRNVQHAIDHEINRQIKELEAGHSIVSETRTFDVASGTTSGMRTKEELNDYRYFPDPDLSPIHVSDKWIEDIKSTMPELPRQLAERLVNDFGIPDYDAQILTESKELAQYFESVCGYTTNYKAASNWMMGPIKSYLKDSSISIQEFVLKPIQLAELISLTDSNKVSLSMATQRLFPAFVENNDLKAIDLAEKLNLIQESDEDTISLLIDQVIENNPQKVIEYKNGKKALIGMFMGEVMKLSKGKADPKQANKLLKEKLD